MQAKDLKDNSKSSNWLIDEQFFKKQSLLVICLLCLLTLFFHVVIFYSFILIKKDKTLLVKKNEKQADYEFVYYEAPARRFVETNTDLAPEAPPENTVNFAAQSQQASQLNPGLPSLDDMPTLEGENEIWSKIVEGSLVAQEEIIEMANDYNEKPQQDVYGELNLMRRPKPKPRPKLNPSYKGPLKKNDGAVSKFGSQAVNARFTEFGAYTQKMFESIGYQSQLLFENYNATVGDLDSHIAISYSIDDNGSITTISVVSATASNLAIILVKDAILSQAPFGPWTDDMKAILNKEEKFLYCLHLQ